MSNGGLGDVGGRLDALEATVQDLTSRLTTLEQGFASLQGSIESSLESLIESFAPLQTGIDDITSTLSDTTGLLQDARGEVASHSQTLARLSDDVSALADRLP